MRMRVGATADPGPQRITSGDPGPRASAAHHSVLRCARDTSRCVAVRSAHEPPLPPARTRSGRNRPVTVGLIGAGKFGTMFLSQARLTRGLHVVARRRSQRRARAKPARHRRLAGRAVRRGLARRRGEEARAPMSPPTPQAMIAHPGIEVIVEATGIPEAGIAHALAGHRARQAHRHGQRRGRRAGRSVARAQGEGRGRGLQPRLGRPAGADLRARRLGARLRLQGGRRRQGHALRAALSPIQSRQRLGHPRQVSQHHRPQVDQSEDVQLASSTAPSPASR